MGHEVQYNSLVLLTYRSAGRRHGDGQEFRSTPKQFFVVALCVVTVDWCKVFRCAYVGVSIFTDLKCEFPVYHTVVGIQVPMRVDAGRVQIRHPLCQQKIKFNMCLI